MDDRYKTELDQLVGTWRLFRKTYINQDGEVKQYLPDDNDYLILNKDGSTEFTSREIKGRWKLSLSKNGRGDSLISFLQLVEERQVRNLDGTERTSYPRAILLSPSFVVENGSTYLQVIDVVEEDLYQFVRQ